MASRSHLSSPDQSEGEFEDREEEVESEEDEEEHVYQTLERQENLTVSKTVCDPKLNPKVRKYRRSFCLCVNVYQNIYRYFILFLE